MFLLCLYLGPAGDGKRLRADAFRLCEAGAAHRVGTAAAGMDRALGHIPGKPAGLDGSVPFAGLLLLPRIPAPDRQPALLSGIETAPGKSGGCLYAWG